jgi:S-adenosylmethionine:tRNA ribosyltransferase-isomerase
MMAATEPTRRSTDAKLMVIGRDGSLQHRRRSALTSLLRPGDLMIANDAATLPASLFGVHRPTGRPIEVRLAGRNTLDHRRVSEFSAVVFGSGDFRVRTEHRPPPPRLVAGDRCVLGPLRATVARILNHPRLVALRFEGSYPEIWEGLARHGKPIQYAHLPRPLALWDTWTAVAAAPIAFEPPSAGFVLAWNILDGLAACGVDFATLTHAAGLSSTGDRSLDARLPFDEPYRISAAATRALCEARARGGRVIAVGTTVVRALEHAAARTGTVVAGEGLANQRIGAGSELRVVDALLTGTHERGSSHHGLLRAFVEPDALDRADHELESHGYRTHEFGDSMLIERAACLSALARPVDQSARWPSSTRATCSASRPAACAIC